MAEALAAGPVDGILTLGPGGAKPALDAVRASGLVSRVKLATFDLSPDVLAAVRDGKLLFAVDQQPYLQGFLPVMLLAERARYGVFPGQGKLIPTGPNFVTEADAAEVIRLSAAGVR
jgi:simple sugar transport system substrate-binding protein